MKKIKEVKNLRDWKYYKEYKKEYNEKDLFEYIEYKKLIRALWKEVGELMLEDEEGVFIKGVGYFAIVKAPYLISNASNFHYKDILLREQYNPTIVTDIYSRSPLKNFTADYSFNKWFKDKLSKKISSGKKYRFEYNTAKQMATNL